jgi:hypothetical protein
VLRYARPIARRRTIASPTRAYAPDTDPADSGAAATACPRPFADELHRERKQHGTVPVVEARQGVDRASVDARDHHGVVLG